MFFSTIMPNYFICLRHFFCDKNQHNTLFTHQNFSHNTGILLDNFLLNRRQIQAIQQNNHWDMLNYVMLRKPKCCMQQGGERRIWLILFIHVKRKLNQISYQQLTVNSLHRYEYILLFHKHLLTSHERSLAWLPRNLCSVTGVNN